MPPFPIKWYEERKGQGAGRPPLGEVRDVLSGEVAVEKRLV